MGAAGIYYRATFGERAPRSSSNSSRVIPPALPGGRNAPPSVPVYNMTAIDSADVTQMVNASSAELLEEINEKAKIWRIGPLVAALVLIGLAVALSKDVPPAFVAVISLLGAVGYYFARRRDIIRKTVVLMYEFEPELELAYDRLHQSTKRLANCSGCWRISATTNSHDKKYHAGASDLVSRERTKIRPVSPPFLKTNIETVAVEVGKQTIYFFPDRILVFDTGRIGAVGYEEIRITHQQTRFIEQSAPSDALVVDRTWRYVNKKGGPDRRFANNPQLPVCQYEEINFTSLSGLNERIMVSRTGIAGDVASAVEGLARYTAREMSS
jgi:hypothetical protein